MHVYISGNDFLVSSELQELSLSGLLRIQCTSSFPPARMAVDAEKEIVHKDVGMTALV